MTLRAAVSRRIIKAIERHAPAWIISYQVQVLLDLTARGFGTKGKQVRRLPPAEALEEYRTFTIGCMESIASSCQSDREEILRRLYEEAYNVGSRIRHITGLTDREDLQDLVFLLYKNIDIVMSGSLPGEVVVSDCFFGKVYTPEQCDIMSRVDAGIITGICGDGEFGFMQRITEGCDCCRARLFCETCD